MAESMTLRLGEERPFRLPPAEPGRSWTHDVSGMASAVEVRKMWTSDPYPDDEDDDGPAPPRYMVFMVRGRNPGRASVRFACPGQEDRVVEVEVRGEGSP